MSYQTLSLFEIPEAVRVATVGPRSTDVNCDSMRAGELHAIPAINGLFYIPEFLDEASEATLIMRIDAEGAEGKWLDVHKTSAHATSDHRSDHRRVQHYGWQYDYNARTITLDQKIGPLPAWLEDVARRLYEETRLFDRVPDQAIVNEYEPGQGIARHADRECFGPTVATVSLGDEWEMRLTPGAATHAQSGDDIRRQTIMLARGSALVLSGKARTDWQHEIMKRGYEDYPDHHGHTIKRPRHRRLSLTFRTVNEHLP